MDWGQTVVTLADALRVAAETVQSSIETAQTTANQVGAVQSKGLDSTIVAAIIGAIIAGLLTVAAPFFYRWYTRRADVRQEKKRFSTDEERYRDWVINQYRLLYITGLRVRTQVAVELEHVYISLSADPHAIARLEVADVAERHARPGVEDATLLFGRERAEKMGIAEALKLIDLDRTFGLVILGGPGTGKTTVLKYLALSYARGLQGERLDQPRPLLPLFVTLRSINTATSKKSLADWIHDACDADGCKVSPGFFDQQLRGGHCLVLLDGLDEVADVSQRRQVAQWIAVQRAAYGRNPFLVTCRVAGFREEYLPPGFLRLEIRDFNQDEVKQFARNWCLAVETTLWGDSDEARRRGEAAGADLIRDIQANDRVKQLAVNPLMLSIIALVHRYRVKLPEQRVDLYRECVEVLLGHWDEAKDISVPLPPGKSLQVLQPLALWLHERQQSAEDTDRAAHRTDIEACIAAPLVSIGLQAIDAKGFLDSIRDRSGLLVERALDVFGFQHQTFQEYLAALEIAARGRMQLLVEHFGEAHWREVTLLYAGSQDSSALLTALLQLPDQRVMANWPFVLQLRDEALAVAEDTRQALAAHPFAVLQRAQDPDTAAHAAIHARAHLPDVEALLQCFIDAEDDTIKGHLILLLGETGDPRATDALRPYLTNPRPHIRYLAALALDMLGFEDRQALDDLLMVRIPAGEFIMGSERAFRAAAPRRTRTEAFLIDRFPVTNAQYRRFVKAGGYQEQQYWSMEGWQWKEQENVSVPPLLDDPRFGMPSAPVVAISWYEANAYARWAGKRLPSEQEWERAARGDQDAREFPWGDTFEAGRCNTSEADIDQPTPVGSYPRGISLHGCYDMAGNVWEWTASVHEEGESYRVVRGGSWLGHHGHARVASRSGPLPGDRHFLVGVRGARTL